MKIRLIAVTDSSRDDISYHVQVFEKDEWNLIRVFDCYHRKTAIQYAKDFNAAVNESDGKTDYNATSINSFSIIFSAGNS